MEKNKMTTKPFLVLVAKDTGHPLADTEKTLFFAIYAEDKEEAEYLTRRKFPQASDIEAEPMIPEDYQANPEAFERAKKRPGFPYLQGGPMVYTEHGPIPWAETYREILDAEEEW